MINQECYKILKGINDIKQIPYSELSSLGQEKMKYLFHTDFVLACARNKKMIEEHLKTLEEIKKPNEEFEKYREAMIELAKKHAKVDENGKPVTEINHYIDGSYSESYVIGDRTTYSKELNDLNDKHKKVIEDQKGKEKQFELALQEDCDLELKKVKESSIPFGLSIPAAEAITCFIEEECPEGKETKTLKATKGGKK